MTTIKTTPGGLLVVQRDEPEPPPAIDPRDEAIRVLGERVAAFEHLFRHEQEIKTHSHPFIPCANNCACWLSDSEDLVKSNPMALAAVDAARAADAHARAKAHWDRVRARNLLAQRDSEGGTR